MFLNDFLAGPMQMCQILVNIFFIQMQEISVIAVVVKQVALVNTPVVDMVNFSELKIDRNKFFFFNPDRVKG